MKKILALILLNLLTSGHAFGQQIFVEMDIDWRKTDNYLNIGRLKNTPVAEIPFLTIKYTNKGKDNRYFCKPFVNMGEFANLLFYVYDKEQANEMRNELLIMDTTPFEEESYNIPLVANSYYPCLRTWKIKPKEKVNIYASATTLASYIFFIEESILIQKEIMKTDNSDQLAFFNYKDKKIIPYNDDLRDLFLRTYTCGAGIDLFNGAIENDKIIDRYFIFLKPEETYVIECNLIAHYVMGGNYNFIWNDLTPSSLIELQNNSVTRWDTISLPAKIKEYYLLDQNFIVEPEVLELKCK
jgi:hypothetical protein